MKTTNKQGQTVEMVLDTKAQTLSVTNNGQTTLVAFVRDNKVVIKNDMVFDSSFIRSNMAQFIKNVETGKKRK